MAFLKGSTFLSGRCYKTHPQNISSYEFRVQLPLIYFFWPLCIHLHKGEKNQKTQNQNLLLQSKCHLAESFYTPLSCYRPETSGLIILLNCRLWPLFTLPFHLKSYGDAGWLLGHIEDAPNTGQKPQGACYLDFVLISESLISEIINLVPSLSLPDPSHSSQLFLDLFFHLIGIPRAVTVTVTGCIFKSPWGL